MRSREGTGVGESNVISNHIERLCNLGLCCASCLTPLFSCREKLWVTEYKTWTLVQRYPLHVNPNKSYKIRISCHGLKFTEVMPHTY